MAVNELLIVVATLMSRWRFTGVPGATIAPVAATTLRPSRLPMVIHQRSRAA